MNFEVIWKGPFCNMGEPLVMKVAPISLFKYAFKSKTPIQLFQLTHM